MFKLGNASYPVLASNMGKGYGIPYSYLITVMYQRAGVEIDPKELTSTQKVVLNNLIYERFCNTQSGRVERRNEQVATHQEYSRDYGL